jgi:PHD/YefM family antitoxin component YafN of YafNO toxin-antitoxin module
MDDARKILPITTVKKNLLDIVKDMSDENSTVTVTKNGVAVGIMMTPNRYEGLLEAIEILADPGILKALTASEKDFHSGRVCSHKDIWA